MDQPPKSSKRAADRLRKAAADLPTTVRLARRAIRQLDDLADDEAARIVEDLARLARGQFPGEVKPITTLPGHPLQADTGRFRILFRRIQQIIEVIAIFPKSSQKSVFRGLK